MPSPPSRTWAIGAMLSPVAKQREELDRRVVAIGGPSARSTGLSVRIFLGMHFAPARETLSRSPLAAPAWGCAPSTRSPFAVCAGAVFGVCGSIVTNGAVVDLRSIHRIARLRFEATAGY